MEDPVGGCDKDGIREDDGIDKIELSDSQDLSTQNHHPLSWYPHQWQEYQTPEKYLVHCNTKIFHTLFMSSEQTISCPAIPPTRSRPVFRQMSTVFMANLSQEMANDWQCTFSHYLGSSVKGSKFPTLLNGGHSSELIWLSLSLGIKEFSNINPENCLQT